MRGWGLLLNTEFVMCWENRFVKTVSRNKRSIASGLVLLGMLFSLCGCKSKKEASVIALPLDTHPAGSFEPFFSISGAYASAKLWDVSYDDLDDINVITGKDGRTTIGLSHNDRVMVADADLSGSMGNSREISFSVPGRAVGFYADGDTLYTQIIDNNTNYLAELTEDPSREPLRLPDSNLEAGISIQALAVSEQTVYFVLDNILTKMDQNGTVLKEKKLEDPFVDLTINGQFLYLLEETGEYNGAQKFRLTQLSCESFKEICQVEFSGVDYFNGCPALFPDKEEDAVILNMEIGILRVRPEEKEFSLLINLADYDITTADIVDISEDTLTLWTSYDVIGEREQFDGLVRCSFGSGQKERTPIRAVLYDVAGDYIPIIAAFNRSQSEYYCSIEDQTSLLKDQAASLRTEEDVKRAFLNILKDKDTIDLFFFPADDLQYFSDNQVLMDLNTLYSDYDPFLPNVLQASETEGKRYFATPFYSLILEAYDERVMAASDLAFETVTQKTGTGKIYHPIGSFSQVDLERCCAYIRKEFVSSGEVSEETLRTFFRIMKIQDNKYYEALSLRDEIENGSVLMLDLRIKGFGDLVGLSAFFGEQLGICGPWGYSSPAIYADEYIGISAGTKNTEACKCLLSFFYSYDVQYSFAGEEVGLPIRQDALTDYLSYCVENADTEKAKAEYHDIAAGYRSNAENDVLLQDVEREISEVRNETEHGMEHMDRSVTEEPLPKGVVLPSTKEEYLGITVILEDMTGMAQEYYFPDEELMKILYEEYLTFQSGEKSEEDVVHTLKSRLDLCWAERNT